MITLVYLHLWLDFVYYEGIYSIIKEEGKSFYDRLFPVPPLIITGWKLGSGSI